MKRWYVNPHAIINHPITNIPSTLQILTTIGRSPNLLRELLAEARREYLLAQAKKTTVYTISPTPFAQKSWDQGRHRPSRDISTVILPPESKKLLLRDVKEYLNPVTARWYAQRGLPYRRGYLFYGPPGTGKTSLSLALAGELKVPLYILSLSTGSLTDETLTMLFVGLPKKCIVLLEDIDCAGVQRNNNGNFMFDDSDSEEDDEEDYSSDSDSKSGASKNKETKSKKKTTNKMEATTTGPHNRMKTSVSFSGLLNAIDGVASHEGRILIMTTNHRERLDPALIRPGRVDMQVEFGYAGRDTLEEIFRELYSQVDGMDSATIEEEEEVFGGEDEPLIPSEKKARNEIDRQAQYTHLIAELAEKFARMIPADKFTPAEVQGFLISYKRAPRLAIRNLPAWLDSKRSANEKKGLKKTKKAKSEETPESRKPGPSKGLSVNTMGLHNDELRNLLTEIINTVLKDNKILQHDNKANKAPPTPISPTSPTPVKNEVTTIERPVDLGYNE